MRDDNYAAAQGSWTSIFLIYVIGVLGATTIPQVVPIAGDIARIFHTGAHIGWIISAPSLLVVTSALLMGWFVDRLGDKPMMIAGGVTIVFGDIGVAVATSFWTLLAMRLIEGIGFVAISVATITMISRITHGARRNIALTLWATQISMSWAIPFLLVSQLAGNQWRWAFYGHAIVLGALLVMALAQLPAPGKETVASHTSGLTTVLRSPSPYLLGLAQACGSFAQTGVASILPQFLAGKYDVSLGAASAVGTLGMVANMVGCLTVGPLLNRGVRPILVALSGVLCAVAGGLALGLTLPAFFIAIGVSSLMFFGLGLIAGHWALLTRVAPSRRCRGATSGLVTQITVLGVFFGPPVAFAFQAGTYWLREAAIIGVAGGAFVLCIWLALKARVPATYADENEPINGELHISRH